MALKNSWCTLCFTEIYYARFFFFTEKLKNNEITYVITIKEWEKKFIQQDNVYL